MLDKIASPANIEQAGYVWRSPLSVLVDRYPSVQALLEEGSASLVQIYLRSSEEWCSWLLIILLLRGAPGSAIFQHSRRREYRWGCSRTTFHIEDFGFRAGCDTEAAMSACARAVKNSPATSICLHSC